MRVSAVRRITPGRTYNAGVGGSNPSPPTLNSASRTKFPGGRDREGTAGGLIKEQIPWPSRNLVMKQRSNYNRGFSVFSRVLNTKPALFTRRPLVDTSSEHAEIVRQAPIGVLGDFRTQDRDRLSRRWVVKRPQGCAHTF
jgi:hypothetical protein